MRQAIEHVRRMRGGAQSHLMRCDDGSYYVVKFRNNPQGLRVLANDMFGTRLAARMGICVPHVDVVDVPQSLIEHTNELVIQTSSGRYPCVAGKQFGSEYPHPRSTRVYDFVPGGSRWNISNLDDFLGIFVFDKWVCHTDTRQAVFISECGPGARSKGHGAYRAMMIDQGFCFNGERWTFPDAPCHSLDAGRTVYQNVTGMESFQPWLDRLESQLSLSVLHQEAATVPSEWYREDEHAWRQLIERLDKRRRQVRDLIGAVGNARRDTFPNWNRVLPTAGSIASSGMALL